MSDSERKWGEIKVTEIRTKRERLGKVHICKLGKLEKERQYAKE